MQCWGGSPADPEGRTVSSNDITVAYPGREGAHSAAACDRLFPAARIVAQPSFTDVVAAVTVGTCTYGVLPIESSLVGPVNETHDLLYGSALSIVAEAILAIRHCLVAPAAVPLEEVVDRVVQSPKAQCRAHVIAFRRVIEHDIENHLDAGSMECLDHVAELVDGTKRIASGTVGVMGREE